MILISHRGNINGVFELLENNPNYIDKAIFEGFDVEVDVWVINNKLFLGHDSPQYPIDVEWVNSKNHKLWIHCKNIMALEFFTAFKPTINYFWHEKDTLTLTSHNYIWAYPGKQPIKNSIAVMPEIYDDIITECVGVCSNYILKYK